MAEHKHGSMDTTEQEKTFEGFLRFAGWTAAICIGVVILLAVYNS